MKRTKVSQADIAIKAGVSQPVVSAALSDAPAIAVSEATRKKVHETARALGYRIGTRRSRPSRSLPILWLDAAPSYENSTNSSHQVEAAYAARDQQILNQAIQKLEDWDYTLIVKHVSDERTCMDWLNKNRVAGIIWHMGDRYRSLLEMAMAKFCVVSMSRSVRRDMDRVVVNQEEVIRLAMEHLVEQGHNKIAYFGHAQYDELQLLRGRHYEHLLRQYKLPVNDIFTDIPDKKEEASSIKMKKLLDVWGKCPPKERPTAIILSDVHALNLFNEAYARNIEVPEQLSVVGIDNLPYGNLSRPRLTSISSPLSDITESVVELLLARIQNPDRSPRIVMFNPSIALRDSVKKL